MPVKEYTARVWLCGYFMAQPCTCGPTTSRATAAGLCGKILSMTNYNVKDVSEFIAAAPKEARSHLSELRAAVRSAIPKAEEKIGYGKPYYKLGQWLVGFDAYKQHVTFEIYTGQLPAEIRAALQAKGYGTGNKTVQIKFDQKVPAAAIKQLAKAQLKLSAEKRSAKQKD